MGPEPPMYEGGLLGVVGVVGGVYGAVVTVILNVADDPVAYTAGADVGLLGVSEQTPLAHCERELLAGAASVA